MRPEALRLGASAAVVVASAAIARSRIVHPAEHDVFRRVNGLPEGIELPTLIVMQAGSLPAVFVAAAVAHRLDRHGLGGVTALTGTAVWAGCKGMKRLIGRRRPDDHLDDVRRHGAAPSGLGFPSGHAAVAATLATLLAPEVARPVGWILAATAAVTAVARIYVGAHLPLDSIGGTAIGVAVGTTSQLVRP